jgi:branched-chain amino acid transport system permease protein
VEGKNMMITRTMKSHREIVLISLFCLVVIAIPWIVNPYKIRIFTMCGIYAICATGLTLFMGFTGQISLAQAAFFGIGAYTSSILTKAGIPFTFAFLGAGLICCFIGVVFGGLCLRARTIYLAMATLAFMLIVHVLFKNLVNITGGTSGLGGIPPAAIGPVSFAGITAYYYLVWLIVAIVIYLLYKLSESYIGLTLRAIGCNELAAESLSINAFSFRLLSFCLCNFLAGIAGSLYAHLDRIITYENFTLEESIFFLIMAVIGGTGSVYGGLIGATIFTLIGEQLRLLERAQIIILGLMLIIIVIYIPQGIASLPDKLRGLLGKIRS